MLTFPASIEGAVVEHNFENGLLIIHLKKAA
jgi:HSP20 family molecular chaperone IbpA